ncbi:MAG: DUF5119 domain-containing protein [Paramuribaculum sp.]|nr:DUF5119 domain-containing protein [Paramuribaculum sp.]
MKNPVNYILALLPVLFATSCEHKDLYVETGRTTDIEVVFDWRNAPDGNPESMAVYLFDRDGGKPIRYIFTGRDGGRIRVPYGLYDALCMNSDGIDWAQLRNTEDIESFEVYTQDAEDMQGYGLSARSVPRAEGTETERMAMNPGMLWTDRGDGFEVKYTDKKQVITLYPEEAVCHYTVDVVDLVNAGNLQGGSIDATLSGVAEGFISGQKSGSEKRMTTPFVLSAADDGKSLHAEFLTFGQCMRDDHKNILTLYIYLSDGSKRYYTYDVTGQIDAAADPRHVHIVVRGLSLPHPIMSGGGLIPSVDDWISEHVDILM